MTLQRWLLACIFLVSQVNKAALAAVAVQEPATSGRSGDLPLGSSIRLLKRSAPTDQQLNLFLIVDL